MVRWDCSPPKKAEIQFSGGRGASALEQGRAGGYVADMHVPGLRSCYEKVGGIHYVGRMFDKIRLNAAGKLPQEYHANLGKGFDARALSFLDVDYPSLVERVKEGGTDEELLAWCFQRGRHPDRRADRGLE